MRCSEDEYGPVIPWTPVQFAAAAGRSGMTYHLLKLGADPRIKDKFGDDALSIARDLGRTVTPGVILNFRIQSHFLFFHILPVRIRKLADFTIKFQ